MKILVIILGVVIILLGGILIFKNQIIKYAVTRVATKITAAPVHVDSFSLDIFSSTIHITGFKMYNPKGFPEGILVSCPKINIIYDRAALFKRKLHFLIAEIEIKEFVVAINKEGKVNVDSLTVVQEEAGKGDIPKSEPIPMQIDLLNLSIGKVVTKDYTKSEEPGVTVYDAEIHKTFKNITSAQQLTILLIREAMVVAGVKGVIKHALIYEVATIASVEVLPVVIAVKFLGKSSVKEILDQSFEHMFQVSLEVVTRMGKVTEQNATEGLIKAKINGANVTVRLEKGSEEHKTEITVTSRKYFLPKPDIAGGVLYQITEKM